MADYDVTKKEVVAPDNDKPPVNAAIEAVKRTVPSRGKEHITQSPEIKDIDVSQESLKQGREKEEIKEHRIEQEKGEKQMAVKTEKSPAASAGANTLSQVLQKISGYQAAGALAPSSGIDPASWSNMLNNTSNNNDPKQALTWQATLLLKILRAIVGIKN